MTPAELRERREGLGWSVKQVAGVLGVTPGRIEEWEASSQPDIPGSYRFNLLLRGFERHRGQFAPVRGPRTMQPSR